MPTFGGVCFLQLFYFLAPYSIFLVLLGVFFSFCVWFLSFENFRKWFCYRNAHFFGGGSVFLNFSIFLLFIAFLSFFCCNLGGIFLFFYFFF